MATNLTGLKSNVSKERLRQASAELITHLFCPLANDAGGHFLTVGPKYEINRFTLVENKVVCKLHCIVILSLYVFIPNDFQYLIALNTNSAVITNMIYLYHQQRE